MRHRKAGRKLNRTSSHRNALFKNMTVALIEKEIIRTTVAKAKELRRFAEPLITLSKSDTIASRRIVFSRLRNRGAVVKLFGELGPRFRGRNGGYLRVVKCGLRSGDSAPLAYVELTEEPAVPESL